jgi:UDP-2,4-diacetamido-2,4,6-trideoxy-beta-L-altropyranose hydrolase
VGGGARGQVVTPRAMLAADCGSGVGLGHLERILALADELAPDLEVLVILPQGDDRLRRRVTDRGHTAVGIAGDSAHRAGAMATIDPSADVIVLDGYVFDVALQRQLRERAPLVVIDDLRLPADCDLGVNPSPAGEQMRPSGVATFLGGPAFALVRTSFLEARAAVGRRGRALRTVLVSTGATDLDGIGGRVTTELLGLDASVEVVRVVGPDTPAVDRSDAPREQTLVAPSSLADALAGASVYVGAAGTTAVQAACVGIPAVITAAVPNQAAQAAALAASGCAIVTEPAELATACLGLLDDPGRGAEMSARGRALIDGSGASRVAEAIRTLVTARATR